MDTPIYKIVSRSLWREAEAKGRFEGAPVDLKDGYIHFSTGAQIRETAERHFSGEDGLLLLAIDATALGAALKWEPSRGGQLFPHLYGPLALNTVLWIEDLPLAPDGHHTFPASVR